MQTIYWKLSRFSFLVFGMMSLWIVNGFSDTFVLDNQTKYPQLKAKMAIEWANSSQQINDQNQALLNGSLNPNEMRVISQPGKVELTSPQKAVYFRVLIWSKGEKDPDLHTNWVEIIPQKTYILKNDQLIPSVLMAGMGC